MLRCKKKGKIFVSFLLSAQLFFLFLPRKLVNFWLGNKIQTNLRNKEHDPSAKAKFKLVIKSNVFEKVHDHPTCFSKSNKCHHANYDSITTYQPLKWLRNIDVFPKKKILPCEGGESVKLSLFQGKTKTARFWKRTV